MSDIEKISDLEKLNELGNNALEQMENVQPVEIPEEMREATKPTIEGIEHKPNISFKGGNCICSCDLTCTRA